MIVFSLSAWVVVLTTIWPILYMIYYLLINQHSVRDWVVFFAFYALLFMPGLIFTMSAPVYVKRVFSTKTLSAKYVIASVTICLINTMMYFAWFAGDPL